VRFFKFWVGLAMVAALLLGITLGNFVVAGGGPIGSQHDPLVSESYVTQAVQERTTALELQILQLEQQVASLTNAVEMLGAQVGGASATGSSGGGTATVNQPGNTSGATGSTAVREMVVTVSNNAGVNVRSGPSTNFEIISSLTNGTRVNVISEASGWHEVTLDGNRTGWVSSDFLR